MADKPTQHRVLKQTTLALAGAIERGFHDEIGRTVPVRFDYLEPARGKPEPHFTLLNYWIERTGERNPDRVLCRTETGEEYHRAPPLLMIARYALTAWAPAPDDQELLVGALRLLYDNPELAALGGANAKDEDAVHWEDKPTIDLSTRFSLEEHRLVAEAHGMPLRPTIRVDVSFRVDSERKTPVKRVKERVIDYRKMDG